MPVSQTDREVMVDWLRRFYGAETIRLMNATLTMGPPPPIPPWHIRLVRRIKWRWYDARVWVAEKVLRLPQDSGDLY